MEAFIAGAWRSPSRGEIIVGGAARRLTRGESYIGGQWRTVARFLAPLSTSANDVFGNSFSTSVSGSSTCTPSGGLGPYTYAWVITSGPISLSASGSATATFSATVPYNTTKSGTARVTCTDALGSTAISNIQIALSSERDTGNQ